MKSFKPMNDRKYVLDLLKTLSRRKKISVVVQHYGLSHYAVMSFNPQKVDEFFIAGENERIDLSPGDEVEIRFFYKEIFYAFSALISSFSDAKAVIQCPTTIYTSFKRLTHRYQIDPRQEAFVYQTSHPDQPFRLHDISVQGLALISDLESFQKGDRLRDLQVMIGTEFEINAEAEVKHFYRNHNGKYVYGLSFVELEWPVHQKLFHYIFQKSYPDLKPLADFTREELSDLYDESRYLSLKPKDDEDQAFMSTIISLEQLNYKPELATNLIYARNGKLLSIGSVLRIYDRTFLGHPLLLAPGACLNPKAKTDIYIGLADFILNHPFGENYLSYITNDLEWHQDVCGKIKELIDDREKFQFDLLSCFEYRLAEITSDEIPRDYRVEVLDNPGEFLSFAADNLSSLENQCYHYRSTTVTLLEIESTYQPFGYRMGRKLWRVLQNGTIVAYVIGEAYSDVLNLYNMIDGCRIFLKNENGYNGNIGQIINALSLELREFLSSYQKEIINIYIDVLSDSDDLNISGLKHKGNIGRVMANREGLSEYKKLLMANFEYYTKYYPLTYPQRGIWFKEKMYPNTSINNIAGTIKIRGEIDYLLFENALNILIKENDIMRVCLDNFHGEIKQYISEYKHYKVEIIDFTDIESINNFYEWEEQTTGIPFEQLNSNLFYFALINLKTECAFYLKLHHLISDAWSLVLIVNQIFKNYLDLKNRIHHFNERPSYVEYILDEEEYKNSCNIIDNAIFWEKRLHSEPEFVYLKNHDYSKTTAKRRSFIVSEEVSREIKEFCLGNKISEFVLFISALFIYINRITSKTDIVIGTTVLNRKNCIEKSTIGMYVNTIPLRVLLNTKLDFFGFVKHLLNDWKVALKNQKYPYELILKNFIEKNKGFRALYDVSLTFQNAEFDDLFKEVEIVKSRWHGNKNQINSLSIHINNREKIDNYIFNFDYLVHLYSEKEIEEMYIHYLNVLLDSIKNPLKKICNLDFLKSKELNLLLHLNNNFVRYPRETTIHQVFEEQARKSPSNIALIYEDKQFTYEELNKKANYLANKIRDKIKPNEIVGIMINRSCEMIIGLLGILKAGGAYLPIDPDYPEERITYMIDNSNIKLLIIKNNLDERIKYNGVIIDISDNELSGENESNLINISQPDDLAYVIYTSGSTGKPKGVMIDHKAILNTLFWRSKFYQFNENDIVLQIPSFSFDSSVEDIFTPLISGSKLLLIPFEKNYFELNLIKGIISNNNVSHFLIIPSLYKVLLEEIPQSLKNLRFITLAGESFSKELVMTHFDVLPNVKLFNEYGPTESSVCTTVYELKRDAEVLIGKPISNKKCFVLNNDLNLQPIGIPGELYIGGEGLAKGYLNEPDLTKERFLPNPYMPKEIIYKTGDIVKLLPNGEIQFLGRIDEQIKVNGFRIELNEIEECIKSYNTVKNAIVVAKDNINNKKYLCVYLIVDDEFSLNDLKLYLAKKLPSFMFPNCFIKIKQFPLLPNGKVDKKALPEPNQILEYVHPRNEIEEKLSEIFYKFIGKKISINENFFEYGIDSLIIMRIQIILLTYNWNLSTQDFYQFKTIEDISNRILGLGKTDNLLKEEEYLKQPLKRNANNSILKNNIDSNIFLTGVTGFLGAHILENLIHSSRVHIYCLVRENNFENVKQKLLQRYRFYFPNNSISNLLERITIINGDITVENFGLQDSIVDELSYKVNTVIHSAAIVKLYGDYEDFEEINVKGTQQIINFSIKNNKKLFHISTTSILEGLQAGKEFGKKKLNENDFYYGQNYRDNVYIHSKFKAEKIIFQAILESNLKAAIFRVGNLTGRFIDGQSQINLEENKFYNLIRSIINIGAIPDKLLTYKIEFTPVDYCSKAVISLLNYHNKVFHLFNHNYITMYQFIKILDTFGINIKILDEIAYKNLITKILGEDNKQILLKGIINELTSNQLFNFTNLDIDSKITIQYLKKQEFNWPEINRIYVGKILHDINRPMSLDNRTSEVNV